MISWSDLPWGVFAILILAALITDIRTYRIPNILVTALAASGLIFVLAAAPGQLWEHVLAAGLALLIGFALHQLIGLGAGDAKLFAAVMLWLGAGGVVPFLFWFGLFCGMTTVILLLGRWATAASGQLFLGWKPFEKGAPAPLALAIAPAACMVGLQLAVAS